MNLKNEGQVCADMSSRRKGHISVQMEPKLYGFLHNAPNKYFGTPVATLLCVTVHRHGNWVSIMLCLCHYYAVHCTHSLCGTAVCTCTCTCSLGGSDGQNIE